MAEDKEIERDDAEPGDEYEVMLVLERLESLREELEECGFGTIGEIETALAMTTSGSNGSSASANLASKRSQLEEIREEMLDLDVDSLKEINDQIRLLHQQLDLQDDD